MLNNIVGLLAPAPSLNSYESIQTVPVTTSQSSISFTTIPSTYKHLQIRATYFNSASIVDMKATFNSDTAANYSIHYLYGTGSAVAAAAAANASYALAGVTGAASNQGAGVAIVDILDYADTNKFKTVRTLTGLDTNSTTCFIALESGAWRSTSAITRIDISPSSGTISQYSSFALYGIKG
jgi:hypothetical protein